MMGTHYNEVFWAEFACLLFDVLFTMPRLLHCIGWEF
jgi:hypothetical protein